MKILKYILFRDYFLIKLYMQVLYIHVNIGCTQVQTGANGREWVWVGALGHGGHGEHKNKASGGHLGSCRSGFGIYGRGNFPGHDVFGFLPKMINIECRWMRSGSDGSNRVFGCGKKQKQGKKSAKWVSRACFVMYAQGQKIQYFDRHGRGAHRV